MGSNDQFKEVLQAIVKRYDEETDLGCYQGEEFVVEDEITYVIKQFKCDEPHDVWWWYHMWDAFTILDTACYEVKYRQDFGDEQSDSFGSLLTSIREWK